MLRGPAVPGFINRNFEIWRKARKQADFIRQRDQHVFVFAIRVRQRLNQITNVRSDAEIPQVPDVDDDFDHARAGRPRGLFCRRGPFQFPTVQRESIGELLNLAPDT